MTDQEALAHEFGVIHPQRGDILVFTVRAEIEPARADALRFTVMRALERAGHQGIEVLVLAGVPIDVTVVSPNDAAPADERTVTAPVGVLAEINQEMTSAARLQPGSA